MADESKDKKPRKGKGSAPDDEGKKPTPNEGSSSDKPAKPAAGKGSGPSKKPKPSGSAKSGKPGGQAKSGKSSGPAKSSKGKGSGAVSASKRRAAAGAAAGKKDSAKGDKGKDGDKGAKGKDGKKKDGDKKEHWWQDRRKLLAAIGVFLVLGGAAVAFVYSKFDRPDDVRNGDVIKRFKASEEPDPVVRTTNWPNFGFDRARTRYFPTNKVHPPFKRRWKYGDNPLLEFPPIFVRDKQLCVKRKRKPKRLGCEGRLFFVNNNGEAFSLDANTGRIMWKRKIAELNATSPAYSRGRLFITNLEPGQALALDAKTGKTIWKKSLPGRSESSPVVVGRRVYFGCECGELYAFNTRNGKTQWSTDLGGEIKAAPAFDSGVLYVGTYSGVMYAVRARNGDIVWQSDALGGSFGTAGAFYATPAVAFGRVYSGNNDSRVYSFDQETGELAWSYSTGDYVYSGTAVADTKRSGPTVYVGSYDGNAYAINARNGELRWSASMGGRVIGSVVVIGETVYIAEFDDTNIYGFRLRDGKKKFSYHTGAYMPAITDGRRLYLVGYSSIHALDPVKASNRRSGAGRDERRRGRSARQRASGADR